VGRGVVRSLRGWRLYPALVIDVSVIGLIWIFVPARFQTPMATIALFAPDEFAVLTTMTALAAVCAAARIVLALRSRRLRVSPTDHALAG
jgi:hypothetical protein